MKEEIIQTYNELKQEMERENTDYGRLQIILRKLLDKIEEYLNNNRLEKIEENDLIKEINKI